MDNFLPVNRELQKHWIYKDSSYLHCWLEMLFNARFSVEPKTDIYKGVLYTINRGEFIYSRPTYAARLNVTEGKLRTLVKLLISDGMITEVKSLGHNKPTIYKINNYELYNSLPSEHVEIESVESNDNQVETKSQPSDNQVTTKSQPLKNIDNKVKKENNEILYQSVFDYYLSAELIKHKSLTTDMKKAIDKAQSELNLDIDYFKRIIDRHKQKVNGTIKNEYPTKTRPLAELFGQKKYNSVSLICTDYLDEVWEQSNKPQQKKIEKIDPSMIDFIPEV